MPRSFALIICACSIALAATACTRVPELEDRLTADLKSIPYPTLVPLDQAVEPLPLPGTQSAELEQQLAARSARLKKRAKALSSVSE
ncbi:MAG: hypothetical protein COB16_00615 [Rhodobacteraceae bacterium]|nr:MAG: hypothetical protein COB16_00615 [Paracoccaceae bacterium]